MFGTKFYKNRWRPSNFRRIWFFYFFLSWHQILKIRCIHEDFSVRKPKSSNGLPWKRTLWNRWESNMGIPIHMLFFSFSEKCLPFCYFCTYQKSCDMRYSYWHTESKTVWLFCFRWSISEISSTAQTSLFFEDMFD